jgi:hypothetical protein
MLRFRGQRLDLSKTPSGDNLVGENPLLFGDDPFGDTRMYGT